MSIYLYLFTYIYIHTVNRSQAGGRLTRGRPALPLRDSPRSALTTLALIGRGLKESVLSQYKGAATFPTANPASWASVCRSPASINVQGSAKCEPLAVPPQQASKNAGYSAKIPPQNVLQNRKIAEGHFTAFDLHVRLISREKLCELLFINPQLRIICGEQKHGPRPGIKGRRHMRNRLLETGWEEIKEGKREDKGCFSGIRAWTVGG